MEPLKQYVFMFAAGGQARGHCKVQCAGGSARIQVQVRLEITGDAPPLLAVFDAGGNPHVAGALRRSGTYFTLVTDVDWLPQAVCTGAVVSDGSGAILLSAGKVPYDAARNLQKAMGIAPTVSAEEAFSPKGAPHKPKPMPVEPVKYMPPKPAPMPPPMPKPAPPPPPIVEEIPSPPPSPIVEEMPSPPPMPESPQYWWQEPRCPYMEMQPPPPEMQPGCDEPPPCPPDPCDPSYRMQDMQPEFIAQPQHGFDSTGFFTGMQEGDLPSGVVSCPAAALHQADPFHGGEFAGWSWCKVQYEGLHWHYLIGENKTGQGPYSRAVGVPGQYSLRPPPHLKGFDRFAVSRDGTGYWLYFEKNESGM